jgi:hypothetical protein
MRESFSDRGSEARAPPPEAAQTLLKEPFYLLFENQKEEKADAPFPKVGPHIAAITP